MKTLLRAAVLAALVAIASGCAHVPKPPECHGKAVPINSSEIHAEVRP
jgi:Flp pilus assembly protein TadD